MSLLDDSERSGSRPLERGIGDPGVHETDANDRPSDERPQEPGRVSRALADQRVLRPFLVSAVVLAVATLLWIGSELHYQSCLQKAELRTPGVDALSRLVRERDIEGCSRLPF